jgi:uncharacterized repeat protein (TIGR01451 family)
MGGHYILGSPMVWGPDACNCGCHGIIEGYGDCGSGLTYHGELYDQQWHLSTFVVDSIGGRFYLDGQQVSSQPWAGMPMQVGNWYSMLIGAYRTSSFPWSFYKGNLDDLGIWSRALSDEEITALYVASNCQPAAHIYNDYYQTCSNTQIGVGGAIMQINPGNYVAVSDYFGDIFLCNLGLPDGTYTASIDPASFGWETNCSIEQVFNVVNGAITEAPEFLVFNEDACPSPDITIVCPTIRRCSEHTWPITIQACNNPTATGPLVGAYAIADFDSGIIIETADVPFTALGNNSYQFEIGDLVPGQCINVNIEANFSCDLELEETLCMEASLYPVPECAQDTVITPGPCQLPWDHSSLHVEGWCDETTGTVLFTVTNSGEAMQCSSEVHVYLDGELYGIYGIQLGANESVTFSFPDTGGTWILQADQHPLHPGNSHPNDHVEGCGDVEGEGDGDDDNEDGDDDDDDEWEPGLVDDLPCGDESPFVDTFCGQVVGSYDPNDKQGFPGGVGEAHDILPNEQLQFLIRFQNTGTAPAYTVVIRDTLDTDLDIFSVTPGVASHDYSFTMYGERVLQWTFNNIMLADSFSNEEASHGFITYTVNQVADLTNGTEITNSAAIYFDSNEPVITNTSLHTINSCVQNDLLPLVAIDPDGTLHARVNATSYQWIDCSTNEPISGATGLSYNGGYGAFALLVSDGSCEAQSDCLEVIPAAIEDISEGEMKIYPVPATNEVYVVWTGPTAANYVITSPDGRLVSSGKLQDGTNTIDISTLATGNYFLKADNRLTRFVVK